VQVIDEDLGKSGAGSVERHGFQKLIAEIGLGNAGLVVSHLDGLEQLPAADAKPAHDVRVDALQRGGDCRVRLSQRD
jgi:DNA invertase Pin-like site-specific DNA recombinase